MTATGRGSWRSGCGPFPRAVFVDLLRDSGAPLDARALKRLLTNRGVDAATADAAWKRAQPSLRRHRYVLIDPPGRYRWRPGPPAEPVSPDRARPGLATAGDMLDAAMARDLADVMVDHGIDPERHPQPELAWALLERAARETKVRLSRRPSTRSCCRGCWATRT